MPDHDLTRLGSRSFEQIVVSLGRLELGPGLSVFGDGPDGGREAAFAGTIRWSATVLSTEPGLTDDDVWNGYTVIQAKFKLKPAAQPHDNAVWLQRQIKKEIDAWTKAAKNRTRSRLPDYLIFVTNVDLSPVAVAGGIDTVEAYVAGLLGVKSEARNAGLNVRAFKIWHADQIRSMIDAHPEIRQGFDGLLTIGDVLAALTRGAETTLGTNTLEDPLREELVGNLAADRWIRLGQAGGPGDAKLYLDDIAVDVPATFTVNPIKAATRMSTTDLHAKTVTVTVDETNGLGVIGAIQLRYSQSVRTVQHVLQLGDLALSRRQPQHAELPGIVLVGGPGQGKTTLSQLLTQAYRAAMLDGTDLAPEAQAQVDGTKEALTRLGVDLPQNRRWPIRVDLAKYAEDLAAGTEQSLLRWMAQVVSRRATTEVTASLLNSWLRVAPWAVVLDGLDEVPSVEARRAVYERLEEFWAKADDVGADVLMVITTRPTGYDERLPEDTYQQLDLQPLSPADAAALADRLSAKRFESDADMRVEVETRMRAAAADTTTARLMATPLQVTIMSMIVEKYPTLPPDRFTLFDLYYGTVLEREIAKNIAVSRFLADNRVHVDRLHERVGLALHIRSEGAQGAEAVLPSEAVRELAHSYLVEQGFEAEQADGIATRLETLALTRLVLLVPRGAGLGFEIRPLQEMMAARAIVEGPDEQALEALRLAANSSHWRNTWLLAAGKLLVTGDRFQQLLVDLLRALRQSSHPLHQGSAAPELAADMLADGLAQNRPGFERALVQILLTARDVALVGDLRRLAEAFNGLMDAGYRDTVTNHLVAASSHVQRASSAALLDVMAQLLHEDQAGRRQTIKLARNQLALSEPEEVALAAYVALADPPVTSAGKGRTWKAGDEAESRVMQPGAEQTASDLLLAGIGELYTSEELDDGVARALSLLAPVRVRRTAQPPSFAVLRTSPDAAALGLLDELSDVDVITALEIAIGALPPGYWGLAALVARLVQLGLTRHRIGPAVGDLRTPTSSNN